MSLNPRIARPSVARMGSKREDCPAVTVEYLHQILNYDFKTGVFTWKTRSDKPRFWNSRLSGKVAGAGNKHGYIVISINAVQFKAHRLAWLYANGDWPAGQIDHINGQKSDNRIANLRVCDAAKNKQNTGLISSNSSGYKGVHWHRRIKMWRCDICANRKSRTIGYFKTREEAYAAYCAKAIELHGEFANLPISSAPRDGQKNEP